MRGKAIRLSPMWRFLGGFVPASTAVPTVPVQRRMSLARLIAARAALPIRPSWTAIFTKAYALVAADMPELRRAYLKFPWSHLCEYPRSAATVAVERDYAGEKAIFFSRIKQPDRIPLPELSSSIARLREVPIEQQEEFRRVLTVSGFPTPVRRVLWWLCLNTSRLRSH